MKKADYVKAITDDFALEIDEFCINLCSESNDNISFNEVIIYVRKGKIIPITFGLCKVRSCDWITEDEYNNIED